MGLISAVLGAAGGALADQWKEFFYCDSISKDVLVVKGQKRVGGRSSNTRGSDNIITSGSGIAVADGQCMIIVDNGKIVEVCAEPGEFTYDASTEPTIFCGDLGQGIIDTFKNIGKRITYGGDTGHDQRVYYFNTKEIIDNKFGTANPIPFRIVDTNIGLDLDSAIRCSGVYSYKITDPLLFYTNVCANVTSEYRRNEIDPQLKTEFITALQPAFAKISTQQLRPNEIPAHAEELAEIMNSVLSEKWAKLRGISVVSVALNPITIPEEDSEMIKKLQRAAALSNPSLGAGTMVGASAEAMTAAASNSAGAMTGFMGLGMAQQAGGIDAGALYGMAAQQKKPAADTWTCSCGAQNTGKFCTNCGTKKPEPAGAWTCSCGTQNTGNFCTNCGSKKPDAGWTCSCGTENTGKFCTNCGAKKPE